MSMAQHQCCAERSACRKASCRIYLQEIPSFLWLWPTRRAKSVNKSPPLAPRPCWLTRSKSSPCAKGHFGQWFAFSTAPPFGGASGTAQIPGGKT